MTICSGIQVLVCKWLGRWMGFGSSRWKWICRWETFRRWLAPWPGLMFGLITFLRISTVDLKSIRTFANGVRDQCENRFGWTIWIALKTKINFRNYSILNLKFNPKRKFHAYLHTASTNSLAIFSHVKCMYSWAVCMHRWYILEMTKKKKQRNRIKNSSNHWKKKHTHTYPWSLERA